MSTPSRQTFLICDRCGVATVHTLLCSADSDFEYLDAEGHKGFEPATYSFFQCNGCTRVSLYIWSALHRPPSEFGEQDYPKAPSELGGVPATVRMAYEQAQEAKSHSKLAYAMLARRVLDVIAKDRCPEERNLSRALGVLARNAEIPPVLAEAAKHIRLFGNSATHEAEASFNEMHVRMIETFLAAMVDYLYTMPSTLHEFKMLLDLDGQEQTHDSSPG